MTDERPTIGIAAPVEPVDMGPWKGLPAVVQDQRYTRSVQRAGARAVLLPPDAQDAEDPAGLLDLLDGLMLAGGTDLAPSSYGAEPHAESDAGDELRDRFEIALISAALERELPLLAICRGVQVMNVARGGDVVQHLPDVVGHDHHRPVPGAWAEHGVRTDPSSRVGTTVGARIEVKSHHHQGLGELGSGLRPVAWSEQDDLVEGLEDPELPFALGVLWHPEQEEEERLVEQLVAEARAYREAGRPAGGSQRNQKEVAR